MNAQKSLFSDQAPTLDEVMSAWGKDDQWLTRKQIADKLGRSKSPVLVAQLGILQAMGYLASQTVTLPNNVAMFMYCPTNKWADDGHIAF